MLISGGWDNRIIFWDLRENKPIHAIKNRMTCGDAIDVIPGEMLSCSFSEENQLSRYDIYNFKKITNPYGKEPLEWEIIADKEDLSQDEDEEEEENFPKTTFLYCGRFSGDGQYVLAGGAYSNEARILSESGKLIFRVWGLSRAVQCCDWNSDDSQFCIGGGDGYIRLFDVKRLPELDYGI